MKAVGLFLVFSAPSLFGLWRAYGVETELQQLRAIRFFLRYLREQAFDCRRPFPEVYEELTEKEETAALRSCGFFLTLRRTGSLSAAFAVCSALREEVKALLLRFGQHVEEGLSASGLDTLLCETERALSLSLEAAEKDAKNRKHSAATLGLCAGALLVLLFS